MTPRRPLLLLFLSLVVSVASGDSFGELDPAAVVRDLAAVRNAGCANLWDVSHAFNSTLDLEERLSQLGLPHVQWNALESPVKGCKLVVIAADSVEDLLASVVVGEEGGSVASGFVFLVFILGDAVGRLEEVFGAEAFSKSEDAFALARLDPPAEGEADTYGVYRRRTCGDVGVPVGIWEGSELKRGDSSDVFSHQSSAGSRGGDLSCKDLRVVTFGFEPFITIDEEGEDSSPTYGGIEILVLEAVAGQLGFGYAITAPSDGGMWGEEASDGNFSGLVGDLQRGVADVGFADLFMIPNRRKIIDYTDAYEFEYVCFMVLKPSALPQWMALVTAFPTDLWAMVLLTSLASMAFAAAHSFVHPRAEHGAANLVHAMTGMLVDESQPHVNRMRTTTMYVFFAAFLLGVMILNNSYKSGLTSNLSTSLVPDPIDTLEEVASYPAPVASFGDTFLSNLRQSIDPTIREITSRYLVHYDFGAALANVSRGEIVMGESRMFLDYSIRKGFTDEFGETDMHVLGECLSPFQVAFALGKDSQYTAAFGAVIQRLKEAGFIGKWIHDEMEKVARLAPDAGAGAAASAWTVAQLQGPFLLYLMLVAAGLLAFAAELAVHSALKKRPTASSSSSREESPELEMFKRERPRGWTRQQRSEVTTGAARRPIYSRL